MQLNIKDSETHEMVTRLAEATGVSKAHAVKEAVREKLQQVDAMHRADKAQRLAEVLRLAASIRSRLPEKLPTQAELDDWMYGEDGLPR